MNTGGMFAWLLGRTFVQSSKHLCAQFLCCLHSFICFCHNLWSEKYTVCILVLGMRLEQNTRTSVKHKFEFDRYVRFYFKSVTNP